MIAGRTQNDSIGLRELRNEVAGGVAPTPLRFPERVRNEDNFSLQLQGTDGAFHMLMKTEIAKLERTGRYRVVMTRESDTFIPLETRVQIARRADADLFISLHSDSGPDPSVRGATVYTLSDKGSDRVVRGEEGAEVQAGHTGLLLDQKGSATGMAYGYTAGRERQISRRVS